MMLAIDLNPIDDIVSGVFGVGGDVIGDAFKSAFTPDRRGRPVGAIEYWPGGRVIAVH